MWPLTNLPHRALLNPVMSRLAPGAKPTNNLIANDDHTSEGLSAPVEVEEDEDPTERTPLVRSSSGTSPKQSSRYDVLQHLVHPIFTPAVLGLLVGCIKPIQSYVFGLNVNDTSGTWVWNGIGFAIVEMVGIGAGIRAGEKKL
jgi:hypothetical protein